MTTKDIAGREVLPGNIISLCRLTKYDSGNRLGIVTRIEQQKKNKNVSRLYLIEDKNHGWGGHKERYALVNSGRNTWVVIVEANEYLEDHMKDAVKMGKKLGLLSEDYVLGVPLNSNKNDENEEETLAGTSLLRKDG